MFEDPALFSADTARAIVMAAQEVKQGLLILLQGLPWNGSLPGGVHGREAELWKHIELHGATLLRGPATDRKLDSPDIVLAQALAESRRCK